MNERMNRQNNNDDDRTKMPCDNDNEKLMPNTKMTNKWKKKLFIINDVTENKTIKKNRKTGQDNKTTNMNNGMVIIITIGATIPCMLWMK